MKMNLVVALTLVSGMAFAGKEGKKGPGQEGTKDARIEDTKKSEKNAKGTSDQKAKTGASVKNDSPEARGVEYLRTVKSAANGNEVYEAAGGIAEAAAESIKNGDLTAQPVKIALRLVELIKSDKSDEAVLKAFEQTMSEFGLDSKDVVKNCK